MASYRHIVGQLFFGGGIAHGTASFSTQTLIVLPIGICSVEIKCYFNPAQADWRLFLYEASLTEMDSKTGRLHGCRRRGVLGVVELHGQTAALADVEKDYCEQVADSVAKVLSDVCSTEESLLTKAKQSLKGVVGDGAPALQKGLRYLQAPFPSISIIFRDPAHVVRKATQEAWVREANFCEFWNFLCEDKHSFIPAVQNSAIWSSLFQSAQKLVKEVDGRQGHGLQRIMRHYSFAKQRYESHAHPQHVYVLCLTAASLMLATIASSTSEQANRRTQAKKLLEKMTPKHAALAGLSADWNCEAADLIRRFDADHLDPAVFKRVVHDWCGRQRLLFLEGRILQEPVENANHGGHTLQTATYTAVKNFMEAPPLVYCGQVKYFWHKDAKREVADALDSIQVVCSAALERLKAEFSNSLVADLSVFDLFSWQQAKKDPDTFQNFLQQSRRQVGRLCQGMLARPHCPDFIANCWRDFLGVAEELASRVGPCRKLDNRDLWRVVEDPVFIEGIVGSPCAELKQLFHMYNGLCSGTSRTERGLGNIQRSLEAHTGPLDKEGQTMAAVSLVGFSGLSEKSLATRLEIDDCPQAWT